MSEAPVENTDSPILTKSGNVSGSLIWEDRSIYVSFVKEEDWKFPDHSIYDIIKMISNELARRDASPTFNSVNHSQLNTAPGAKAAQRIKKTDIFMPMIGRNYLRSGMAETALDVFISNRSAINRIVPVLLDPEIEEPIPAPIRSIKQETLYFPSDVPRTPDIDDKKLRGETLEKQVASIADRIYSSLKLMDKEATSSTSGITGEPALPNIWLAQYSPTDMPTFEDHLEPGHVESWSIGDAEPDELRTAQSNGDTVAIWRAMVEEGENIEDIEPSGIVAWGRINDIKNIKNGKVDLLITDAMPEQPILREDIFEQLGDDAGDWPGDASLRKLTDAETEPLRWRAPAHPAGPNMPEATAPSAAPEKPTPPEETAETRFSADLPETMRDMLGRAPLAFSVAHRINDIWTEQNRERPNRTKHASEQAGFILHIDSPWGGGKTTFANYVARILNPKFFDIDVREKNERRLKNTIFADLKLHDPDFWNADYAARDWITVQFNAWQHQHVKPPWWDFYETIRKQCYTALPPWQRMKSKFAEWIWKLFNPSFRAMLIGLVLLTILMTAILNIPAVQDVVPSNAKGQSTIALIIASLFGASGIALFTAFQKGINKLVSSAGETTDETMLGTSDPLRRFRNHFSTVIDDLHRPVLVIIDDLDRCDPEYVVELVRGMMTVFRSRRIIFILLGDKNWIETSFAKVHKEMADVHDDEGVSFGGRFVEKAIQMSLVLPEADPSQRDSYVDMLLLGERKKLDGEQTSSKEEEQGIALAEFADDFDQKIKDAESSEERNQVAAAERKKLKDMADEDLKLREDIINRKKAIRAASSETTKAEVAHALAPMKEFLPPNPRRIKRIVNMITVYQSSAQVAFGVDEKSVKWYQLMLWVILMSEHPECWEILATDPKIVDLTQAQKKKLDDEQKQNLAKLGHPKVRKLMDGYTSPHGQIKIDAGAVKWLRKLTPTG